MDSQPFGSLHTAVRAANDSKGQITLAPSDMHEHLGQLIAYARMNGIVQPWSQ